MKPILQALLLAALVIGHTQAAKASPLDALPTACDDHDWPALLASYEEAGARGDPRAAEIAGMIHLYGERMFEGVRTDPARARAWLERAQAVGSATAARMLEQLDRASALTAPAGPRAKHTQ